MAELPSTIEHVGAVKAATDDDSPDGQPVQPPGKKANKRTTANAKFRRAYHTKDSQGCKTCRIRRVRCDKLKPACNRCTSTGRKCDGYATTLAHALPRAPPPGPTAITSRAVAQPIPSIPDKSPKELRNFRYFVDTVAPLLGGVFAAEFWMMELPQACHLDDAVWHAIVSLASAHESLVSGENLGEAGRAHTLLHYNLSVQGLLQSYSQENLCRTLTLSILFTSICCFGLKYPEAQMHTKSAGKLIRQMDSSAASAGSLSRSSSAPRSCQQPRRDNFPGNKPMPVSVASLRFMVDALEMKDRWLDTDKAL